MWRRGLLGALLLPLAGCGFYPVYAPVAGGAPEADLSQIFVAVIPDRVGQELRQALQVRLEGSGAAAAMRYTLSVAYGISVEGIGIQSDTSTTFLRFHGNASWRLLPADPAAPTLATGAARVEDGYSIIVNQYFYADLMTDVVERRMADNLADQIVLRLVAYFHARDKVAGR